MALKIIKKGLAVTAGLLGLMFLENYLDRTLNPYQESNQKMIVETLDKLNYDSLEEVVEEQDLNFNDLKQTAEYLRENSPFDSITDEELAYLTRVVERESGGEIKVGREGVTWAILNRAIKFNSEEYPRFGKATQNSSTKCLYENPETCEDLTESLMSVITGEKAIAEFDALRIHKSFFTPESFRNSYGEIVLHKNTTPRHIRERLDKTLYSVVNVLLGNVKDPTGGAVFYFNPRIATSKNPPGENVEIGRCLPANPKVCEESNQAGVCTRERSIEAIYFMVPSKIIGNHHFYTYKRVIREAVSENGNKEVYFDGDLARKCQPRGNQTFCEHYRNGRVEMTSLTDKNPTGNVQWRKYDQRGRVTNRCKQERGNKDQCRGYQANVRRF
jgi:spore germination cell wall hydrolase CwlJ-like protein